MVITRAEQLHDLPDGNRLIGTAPELEDSVIEIHGSGNILVCHPSVRLVGSKLNFYGSDAIIYLCPSAKPYRINAFASSGCVLYIGKDNYFNNTVNLLLTEGKHCVIGNDCIISFGVWLPRRTPTWCTAPGQSSGSTCPKASLWATTCGWARPPRC